ncbi:g3621 [Coccomyxa elongata]
MAVRGQDCVTPYQSAARNSELTYFAQALEATGLVTAFNSSDLVATIFLPKNVAFENLLTSIGMTVDQAIANPGPFTPFLGQILEYHVIPNVALYAANFTNGEVVKTVIADTLTVNTNPFTITPSGGGKATVTFTDFIACKAIEHVLDTVLLPQSVVAAYAASMNGGSTPASTDAAQAPLVMGTSGPDVLTQAVAAAPVVAVPVVVPVVPVVQVPTASLVSTADATKTQVASEVASEIQGLKAEPIVQPPMYFAPPPPAAVALPSKEDLAMGIKDKISAALLPTPSPPMPVSGAVSGVPQATSGTPVLVPQVAGPVTALQLPTLDVPLPLPKKKEIPLPLEPAVPIYKFQLPDIKAEILSLGKDALAKLGLPVTLVRALCPWTACCWT